MGNQKQIRNINVEKTLITKVDFNSEKTFICSTNSVERDTYTKTAELHKCTKMAVWKTILLKLHY